MDSLHRPNGTRAGRFDVLRQTATGRAVAWIVMGLAAMPAWSSAQTPAAGPATMPIVLEAGIEGKIRQAKEAMSRAGALEKTKADSELIGKAYQDAVTAAFAALNQARQESKKGDPQIIALHDQAQQLCFQLADQAKQAKQYAVAGQCYGLLRNVYPPSVMTEPLLGAADVARLAGRFWEAYELYDQYLKLRSYRPMDHRGELGMGLTCLDLRQYNNAVFYLKTAVDRARNLAEAHMGLARAYHGSNKFREAAVEAREAVRLDDAEPPDKRHREYRYWLALILKDAGQLDEAIATAQQLADSHRASIKAKPGDLELIGQLDRVLALRLQLLDTKSKTDQGSKDPGVFLDMAQIVEEQGTIQQIRAYFSAIDLVTIARKLKPDDITAGLRFAGLCRQVGRTDEAIKAYQDVLKASPDNEQAKTALRQMGAPLTAPEPTIAPAPAPAPSPAAGPSILPAPAGVPAPAIAPRLAGPPGATTAPGLAAAPADAPTTAPTTTSKPQ